MYKCHLKPNNCVKCADCCRFSKKPNLTEREENLIKNKIFDLTGFLYLADLNKTGLIIQSYEYEKAKRLARTLRIRLRILPKKVVYDKKSGKTIVFDWYIDSRICPFLTKSNLCRIYSRRFDICKLFPSMEKKIPVVEKRLKLFTRLITENKIVIPRDKPYKELVRLARQAKEQNFEDYLKNKI